MQREKNLLNGNEKGKYNRTQLQHCRDHAAHTAAKSCAGSWEGPKEERKKKKEKSLEALGSYSSKKLQKTDKTQKSRTQFKQFKSESQETKHNSILVVGSSRPHFTFFSK